MRSDARQAKWDRPALLTRVAAGLGLLFLHFPVWVIVLYAFTTEDRTYQFPPPGLTLHWFEVAFARNDIWESMRLSLLVASVATLMAIVLGTLAAFALARRTFRGKESITLLFVLPIALPGILTGLALLVLAAVGEIHSEHRGGLFVVFEVAKAFARPVLTRRRHPPQRA